MPSHITVPSGAKVFTGEVGHYGVHYMNDRKWMTMGGVELRTVAEPKVHRYPGFISVLLPTEVVRITGLPSAVAWIENESTERTAS